MADAATMYRWIWLTRPEANGNAGAFQRYNLTNNKNMFKAQEQVNIS